MYNPALFLYSS